MKPDIKNLSLKELKDLRGEVNRAIANFEDRRKREALLALEEKARDLGFSLAELTGGGRKIRRRAPASAKYANPADPGQTWSGRGRKPLWFAAALKAGKRPEDMAV